MGSQARDAFESNCEDVDRLLEIHGDITPEGRGRRWKVEALHKAAIVLLTAFWEAFCEDLAAEGLHHLVGHGSAGNLPAHLQRLVATELKKDLHDLAVWRLADGGWRDVLTARLEDMQEQRNRDLNTPKSAQINKLFANAIGVQDVAKGWTWPNMSAERAQEKLDEYITLRGDVAHRGKASESITKGYVNDYYGHLKRLVEHTEDRVADALRDATGAHPW